MSMVSRRDTTTSITAGRPSCRSPPAGAPGREARLGAAMSASRGSVQNLLWFRAGLRASRERAPTSTRRRAPATKRGAHASASPPTHAGPNNARSRQPPFGSREACSRCGPIADRNGAHDARGRRDSATARTGDWSPACRRCEDAVVAAASADLTAVMQISLHVPSMQRLRWPFAPRGQSLLPLHVDDAGAVDSYVESGRRPSLDVVNVETTMVASSLMVLVARGLLLRGLLDGHAAVVVPAEERVVVAADDDVVVEPSSCSGYGTPRALVACCIFSQLVESWHGE